MKTRVGKLLCLAIALAGALNATAVNVTFRVNMSVQAAMGRFDPANDFVLLAGTFTGWATSPVMLAQSAANPDVWEGTVDLAAGSWPNYKFVIQRFGVGNVWEAIPDRWFQVPATDTTLDVVYFDNLAQVVLNRAPVTFQVDMSVPIAQGDFVPGAGTLAVSGDAIDNWANAGTHFLAQSPENANLWIGTFEVTNVAGGTVFYKFIMNGVWETRPNRSFVMTDAAQTLPVVHFNDVTAVAVPIPVTFQVNMGVAMARGLFNPGAGDYLEARGSFLADPGGAWLGGFTLTNSPANPILFSGAHTTTGAPGGAVLYQFVINGVTWETIGNRSFVFADTNAIVLPVAFLNNITTLGTLTNTPALPAGADLSWEGGPLIRVQSSASLAGPWQTVSGTEGQSSATVPVGPEQTYFRLVGP